MTLTLSKKVILKCMKLPVGHLNCFACKVILTGCIFVLHLAASKIGVKNPHHFIRELDIEKGRSGEVFLEIANVFTI